MLVTTVRRYNGDEMSIQIRETYPRFVLLLPYVICVSFKCFIMKLNAKLFGREKWKAMTFHTSSWPTSYHCEP